MCLCVEALVRYELTWLGCRTKSWRSLAFGSTSEEEEEEEEDEEAVGPTLKAPCNTPKAPGSVHWAHAPPTRLSDPRVKSVAFVGPGRVYVPPCPFCGQ